MTGLSHKDDYLETPDWLFNQIQEETGLKFNFDLCASYDNKKCKYCVGEDGDILKTDLDILIEPFYCNPPRSINGKIVTHLFQQWRKYNNDIVILLCWNDLGNKYCDELRELILSGTDKIMVRNLGKIKFYKNGKETEFPSRLTYFYVWLKKQ